MTVAPAPATTTRTLEWWWLAFLVFIFFQPAFDPRATTTDWTLATIIAAVYVPLYLTGLRRGGTVRTGIVLTTLVLAAATTPFNSGVSVLFVFAAAFCGSFDPPARARRWLAGCFSLLAVTALFSPVAFPYNLIAFGMPLAFIWVVGLATIADAERDRDAARLRVDNTRIEHLATMAERDRIARDLHDVIGHTLTAVVVQTQLIQRLTERDPTRARAEAAKVEAAAREALSAVRETVAGYRTHSLLEEIEQARSALDAAGVRFSVDGVETDLTPEVERALALALREAVTNVIRHAGARTCRMTLVRNTDEVRLEIVDDGKGGTAPEGNGLRGMRERISALGGRIDRATEAGTRVTVAIPTEVAG